MSEWTPCTGCPFAGEVDEVSVEVTARVSDDLESEDEPQVTFVQDEGTKTERVSGRVYVMLGGGSYGTSDGYAAASEVVADMRACAQEGQGPVTVPRFTILGFGIGAVKACAAFHERCTVDGTPTMKPYCGNLKNA